MKKSTRAIPHRFRVRFADVDGETCNHQVVTWMDVEKAIAMAACQHAIMHKGRMIYSVDIESLGDVQSGPEGAAILFDHELTDRMEW